MSKSGMLIHFIFTGNMTKAKALIEQMDQHELSQTNNFMKETVLHTVANPYSRYHEDREVLKLLLGKMAPEAINAVNRNGETALHKAAESGRAKVAELLLGKMPPETVNAVDKDGRTALHRAASTGNYEVVKLLLDKMSPETINNADHRGKTALHGAAYPCHNKYPGKDKVVELLLGKMSPEAINNADHEGRTVLHNAVIFRQDKSLKLLLDSPALKIINSEDTEGKTALHWAVGCIKSLVPLLSAGANIPEKVVEFYFNQAQERISVTKTYLFVGTCADKVYKGEALSQVISAETYDLFSSRLVSKIMNYGMPKGCKDIKKHLENYAKFLSNELVDSFMTKLANKYLDCIYYKKEQELPCDYARFIQVLSEAKDKLPEAYFNEAIAKIQELRENSMLTEIGLIAQLDNQLNPRPLSILIEKGTNPADLLSNTLKFYSTAFPEHAELIAKYKEGTLTNDERTQLVESLKNKTGYYITAVIKAQGQEILDFMTNKEEDLTPVKNVIKETLLKLSECALPQDVKVLLNQYIGKLQEAEHLAVAENHVLADNLANQVAAIALAEKVEDEGDVFPLSDLEGNIDS